MDTDAFSSLCSCDGAGHLDVMHTKGGRMIKFLSGTVKAGFGLVSITAALLWSHMKGFINAKIFTTMTQEQTYSAFIFTVASSIVLLIVAILITSQEKKQGKTISSDNGGISVDNSGFLNRFQIFRKPNKKK